MLVVKRSVLSWTDSILPVRLWDSVVLLVKPPLLVQVRQAMLLPVEPDSEMAYTQTAREELFSKATLFSRLSSSLLQVIVEPWVSNPEPFHMPYRQVTTSSVVSESNSSWMARAILLLVETGSAAMVSHSTSLVKPE